MCLPLVGSLMYGCHDPKNGLTTAGLLMEVADDTDEGPGGDSQRPITNDNVLYHSVPELASRQAERAGSELCTSGASLARNFLEAEWSPERADFNSLGVSVNVLYVAPSRPDRGRPSVGCL
jgi:hypothetical protein